MRKMLYSKISKSKFLHLNKNIYKKQKILDHAESNLKQTTWSLHHGLVWLGSCGLILIGQQGVTTFADAAFAPVLPAERVFVVATLAAKYLKKGRQYDF